MKDFPIMVGDGFVIHRKDLLAKIYEFDRNSHEISITDSHLVRLAILELGEDEVRNISFGQTSNIRSIPFDSEKYFNVLRSRLADAYLSDTSKTHLREYIDHKLGADLGL
ncbi:hypothetical protein [Pseudomonas shirazensis]|uniref:hypothetical protein n=1 Tax=Pseudomonas shirazensis TaxID=2745494 RepID=UPI003D2B4471